MMKLERKKEKKNRLTVRGREEMKEEEVSGICQRMEEFVAEYGEDDDTL